MKTLLLGGTDLTMALLKALVDSGRPPAGVVSIARDFSISYNPSSVNTRFVDFQSYCDENNIRHIVYNKDVDLLSQFALDINADFCLVAGWFFILPERFRKIFKFGCLGIHASLLPQLKGAAPLNWAILSGMKETGVSLFEIAKGVDEGMIYATKKIQLADRETVTTLVGKVEKASIDIVLSSIDLIERGKVLPKPQSGEESYSCPRSPEDSLIKWDKSVVEIDRLIRASCKPYQGAYTYLNGQKVIIWEADLDLDKKIYGRHGQICKVSAEDSLFVVCDGGSLKIVDASFEDGSPAIKLLLSKNYSTFG